MMLRTIISDIEQVLRNYELTLQSRRHAIPSLDDKYKVSDSRDFPIQSVDEVKHHSDQV